MCRNGFTLIVAVGVLCGLAQGQPVAGDEGALDSLLGITVSTAALYVQTTQDAPASVTVITAEDIRDFGYRTLQDVLATIPGFYTSDDRNYSYIGVRGFGRPTDYNNRVLILLDGHTMNENFYGTSDAGAELGVNMESIERVEIVRGPGSVLYGTNAMFAVINVITKDGRNMDGGDIRLAYGTGRRWQGMFAFGTETDEGTDLSVSAVSGDARGGDLYFPEYEALPVSDGISRGADWERFFGAQGRVRTGGLTVEGRLSSREKGIPTGAFGVHLGESNAGTLDQRMYVDARYDLHAGPALALLARGYFDRYYYEGTYPADELTYDRNDGRWFGLEARMQWDPSAVQRIIAGAEFKNNYVSRYEYWDSTTTYFDATFPFRVFSLYAQDEIQVNSTIQLMIGLRHDAYSHSMGSTTPRVALIAHPSQATAMKLMYGEAFRTPSVYEAQYEDPLGGQKRSVSLTEERIRTYEISLEHIFSKSYYSTLSLYSNRIDGLIDQRIDPADSLRVFTNSNQALAQGVEWSLNVNVPDVMHGYVGYAYQHATDLLTHDKLSNSPSHILRGGLAYHIIPHVVLALEGEYESERLTISGPSTDHRILAHANLSARDIVAGFGCAVLVRNLFDLQYGTPAGFEHIQSAIPQDRRTILVTAGYRF